MSVEYGGLDITRISQAAIPIYSACKMGSAAGTVIVAAEAGTVPIIGWAQEEITSAEGAAGKVVSIRVSGVTKAINGTAGALAEGITVAPESGGRMVAATGADQFRQGVSLEACTADGDYFAMLISPQTKANA
jgi:hypothetical protein